MKSHRGLDDINAARIDGCYDDYVVMMVKKHKDGNIDLKGSVIVVDSYDGAEHHKRRNTKSSIVSFSSQMFSTSTLKSGKTTPTHSFNILTWQKMEGSECAAHGENHVYVIYIFRIVHIRPYLTHKVR